MDDQVLVTDSDLRKDHLDGLIKSAVESITRTRWVLSAVCVMSILGMIAAFNDCVSWVNGAEERAIAQVERDCALFHDKQRSASVASPIISNECFEARMRLTDLSRLQLSELRRTNIPVIGVTIDNDDMSQIAPFALVILLAWMWHAARRENHCFNNIRLAAKQARQQDVARYLYFGVAAHLVFLTTTVQDHPYGLPESDRRAARAKLAGTIARTASEAFLFLPFMACLALLTDDLYTIFVATTPLSNHTQTIWTTTATLKGVVQIIGRIGWTVAMALLILVVATATQSFLNGSQELIRKLKLMADSGSDAEPPPPPPPPPDPPEGSAET